MLSRHTDVPATNAQSSATPKEAREGEGANGPVTHPFMEVLFTSLKDDLQMIKKDLSQDIKAIRKDLTEMDDRVSALEDREPPQEE
ncbi:hypothetical protein NDU88_008946 [Pleurodeles waltl]|uniref:Heat shock factor binding protein 1 n=1 Tax=Pleurodeles waltl TaxID=8319 RepID=A0AAV7PY36_PLEWA|nr:hypothetical protein NDU88_008946 [Pleurodeles waltl]